MSAYYKYYLKLGLPDGASKDEVRKAYRKLAKLYHPDRNPDPEAHKRFVELVEAYEIIMDDRPVRSSPGKNPSRNEKSTEERRKEAEWRYRQQQEREFHDQERYFRKITSGTTWKWFTRFAQLSLLLAVILLFEPWLPSHFEYHRIVKVSDRYNGLISPNEVVCIETDKDVRSFVINPWLGAFKSQPEIQMERSFVFRNPIAIWYPEHLHFRRFDIDFSAINCYPVIPLLFAIPFMILRFKRKTYWFTLGYYASIYLIAPCVLYFLFTQHRWAHLLTLGYY